MYARYTLEQTRPAAKLGRHLENKKGKQEDGNFLVAGEAYFGLQKGELEINITSPIGLHDCFLVSPKIKSEALQQYISHLCLNFLLHHL